MIERKLIIKSNIENRETFEKVVKDVLNAEYDIYYKDGLIFLTIYDYLESINNIKMVFDIISNDFFLNLIILNVPLFDDFMISLIRKIEKGGLYNAYEMVNKLLISQELKVDDVPNYLANIDKELLDVFVFYYESGMNICLTSRLLYLHRNTLNYKLAKLNDELKMNVKDALSANFVYFLLKII